MTDIGSIRNEVKSAQMEQRVLTTADILCGEFRETLRGLVDGGPPRTVMHALLLESDAVTREDIAVATGKQTYEVDDVLGLLGDEGWLIEFVENGLVKCLLKAPIQRPEQFRPL